MQNTGNMNKYPLIGIAGNATAGKDTLGLHFESFLNELGIKCNRTSFAHALRVEVDDFVRETLGFSAFTQEPEQKKLVRPFLVYWGTEIRRKQNPDHWIESLELHEDAVNIVCDVRFPNELDWIKSNGGLSFFVSREKDGKIIPPANDYELENNKVLRQNVDYSFVWQTVGVEDAKEIAHEVLALNLKAEEGMIKSWKQTCS